MDKQYQYSNAVKTKFLHFVHILLNSCAVHVFGAFHLMLMLCSRVDSLTFLVYGRLTCFSSDDSTAHCLAVNWIGLFYESCRVSLLFVN